MKRYVISLVCLLVGVGIGYLMFAPTNPQKAHNDYSAKTRMGNDY